MSLKNGYREAETTVSLANIQSLLENFVPFIVTHKIKPGEEIVKLEFVKCENGLITFKMGIRKEGEVQIIHNNGRQKKT